MTRLAWYDTDSGCAVFDMVFLIRDNSLSSVPFGSLYPSAKKWCPKRDKRDRSLAMFKNRLTIRYKPLDQPGNSRFGQRKQHGCNFRFNKVR